MSDTYTGGPGPSGGAQDAADAGERAKRMAADAGQTVKSEAAQFAQKAKGKAREQVEAKKSAAAGVLGDVADVMHRAAEDLGGRDHGTAADLGHRAAAGLDNLAQMIATKRPEELLDSARDLARRNPVPVAAGSVLLGFAIGRFLRSSNKPDVSDGAPRGDAGAGSEGVSRSSDPQLGLEL